MTYSRRWFCFRFVVLGRYFFTENTNDNNLERLAKLFWSLIDCVQAYLPDLQCQVIDACLILLCQQHAKIHKRLRLDKSLNRYPIKS